MKILITAPSLDVNHNISGISSVVNIIVNNNPEMTYLHLIAGRKDNVNKNSGRIGEIVKSNNHLKKLIEANSFDIFHLNLPLNTKSIIRDYFSYRICKRANKKILVHLHGGKFLFKKPRYLIIEKLIKIMLKNADQLVVLSELEKQTIEKLYNAKNSTVLPNTVEDIFLTIPRHFDKGKSINFLFLGRLHESKGVQHIIEAFNLLNSRYKNISLTICGKGPLENIVTEAVEANKGIKYLGVVGGQKKLDIYAQSQVFLLPSLYGEGLPIALLEAFASGLAPIVTDDGSMKYIIKDNDNALLVKKGDTEDLMKKMQTVIDNEDKLKFLSETARKYFTENYSIDKYINNLNSLYKRINP